MTSDIARFPVDRAEQLLVPETPAKPASHEDQAMAAALQAYRRRVPPTKFRRKPDDEPESILTLEVRHPSGDVGDLEPGEIALMTALGARELPFLEGLLLQIGTVGRQGACGGLDAMSFLLSAVKGIEPRDHVEGMLAAQMSATHAASMHMASRLMSATTVEGRDSAERTFNKLARTFTGQVEALKRYRTGGEQKVTVQHQHVNVGDGGQALVGTVVHGGRGGAKE